jgi:hypothetical protein
MTTKTKRGYKCYACTERASKIGAVEVKKGWGKMQARVGFGKRLKTLTLVHCPDHKARFGAAAVKAVKALVDRKR